MLVGVSPAVAKTIRSSTPIECEFPRAQAALSVWLRALRLHQWLNNLLLFVPLLTSFFLMNPDRLLSVLLAFLAFSLAASATYVVNDLWDLENDRAHPANGGVTVIAALLPWTGETLRLPLRVVGDV